MGCVQVTLCLLFTFMLFDGARSAASTLPEVLDTRGREFILGFLQNQILNPSIEDGQDIEMFFSTMADYSDVNVTLPKFNASWVKVARVYRDETEMITLPHAVIGSWTEIAPKGVHIVATDEIAVSVVNKERLSTDAFVALPVDVLGTEYFALTYARKPEILVVATEDGTEVSITLPQYTRARIIFNEVTYSRGDTLTFTLDRYDMFHALDNRGWSDFFDFTGAHIVSNHPVTVVTGNRKVRVPAGSQAKSADHLTECLLPVNSWGREFPIINTADRTGGDVYRFVAAENDTVVTFDNGENFTINSGEFKEIFVPYNTERFAVASKPVQVALFSLTYNQDGANMGDPSMTLIPPIDQFLNERAWATVTAPGGLLFSNKLSVVIETSKIDGLRLDHRNYTAWVHIAPIPGTNLSHMWGFVSTGSHDIYHVEPNIGFLAIASGTATFNSYTFPANMRVARVNEPCSPTPALFDGDGIDNDCNGKIDEEWRYCVLDCSHGPRVNGNWGEWTAWTPCTVSCGRGYQVRSRRCDSPSPQNGGLTCQGSSVEMGVCDLSVCTDGTGELCKDPTNTNIERHCLSDAPCNHTTQLCQCPHGMEGDPTFHCYPEGYKCCASELDPHLVTYDMARERCNLPCRYRLTTVETPIEYPTNQMFDLCRISVLVSWPLSNLYYLSIYLAVNEMGTDAAYFFVRSMEVKVQFVRYNAQGEADIFNSLSTDFYITQEDIQLAAPDTNPWPQNPVTVNNVLLLPAWDNDNKIALFSIPQCHFEARYRVFNESEELQTMKGGISVAVRADPNNTAFDPVPGYSTAGRPGDGPYRFIDWEAQSIFEPATTVLRGILTDKTLNQSVNNPAYGSECSDLVTTVSGSCSATNYRPSALNLCSPILNEKPLRKCVGATDLLVTYNDCLMWACEFDEAACNSYFATLTAATSADETCSMPYDMLDIGCNTTKVELMHFSYLSALGRGLFGHKPFDDSL